jgi:hypothetical protein
MAKFLPTGTMIRQLRVLPDYVLKARTYFKDAASAVREIVDNIIASKTWNKPASGIDRFDLHDLDACGLG